MHEIWQLENETLQLWDCHGDERALEGDQAMLCNKVMYQGKIW